MSETNDHQSETLGFQTEVKQMLHLMVHSLYSNKEIFLRELISNAADAADKLRFAALSDDSLYESDPDLRIRVDFDAEQGVIRVADNGIGMTRQEVIENLGTIARSGTAQFLAQLGDDQKRNAQLIGQFGVGFYSAFIVADRVEVFSRRAGALRSEGVHWASTGEGDYTVSTIDRPQRGTTVELHLKPAEREFADPYRLRHLVRTYSDHISVPVLMPRENEPEEEAAETAGSDGAYESVNQATALWVRDRNEITEDEYKAFYQHVAHDFQDPLLWSHNRVEGNLEYTTLLYVPARAPFDLWQRDGKRGLKLYVQRIFIMDGAEQFLPSYLRFVRGVVDSNDLSLNVSREMLQQDPAIDSMRKAISKRVLDMLERLAKDDPEAYSNFYREFGEVLKEGPAEDPANATRVAQLLRFSSTFDASAEKKRSLADYLAAMPEGQETIYYLVADSFTNAQSSPHLEVLRAKGIEVLLLHDRIDEWLMTHLREYEGKSFQDVTKGELDLGQMGKAEPTDADDASEQTHKELIDRVQRVVGERVKAVRVSKRLTESPACLVLDEHDMGRQMRELLKAGGQSLPEMPPILELNPSHPLVGQLQATSDEGRFEDLALVLFDQARLASGEQLADPAAYVRRLNHLLLNLMR